MGRGIPKWQDVVPADYLLNCWTQLSSASETPASPVCICVPVPRIYVCTRVFVSPVLVCVSVCVCVQPTAGTEVKVTTCEMWINQKRRYKCPQARWDWTVYLRGVPVHDLNVEMTASDNSGWWFQKSEITSRDINKFTISAVFLCFYQEVGMKSLRSHLE